MSTSGPLVYLAIKFHADHRNRKLVDRLGTVFEKHGLTTYCFARDAEKWGKATFEAHDLMQRALHAVSQSAAVVAEFSEKSVGVGIEAGYASALDIPVFVLLRPDSEVVNTLEGISTEVFRYADDDSLNSAAARIADKLGRVSDHP